MKFYIVNDGMSQMIATTMAEAHKEAKKPKYDQTFVMVEEVEIDMNKPIVAQLLRICFEVDAYGSLQFQSTGKRWQLGKRGGLVEAAK